MPLDQPPPVSGPCRRRTPNAHRGPRPPHRGAARPVRPAPWAARRPPGGSARRRAVVLGTKPSGNWLSDANVRRNSPAATTRTSEMAICATTSVPRTGNLRSPAIPRPASLFSASAGAPVLGGRIDRARVTPASAGYTAPIRPIARRWPPKPLGRRAVRLAMTLELPAVRSSRGRPTGASAASCAPFWEGDARPADDVRHRPRAVAGRDAAGAALAVCATPLNLDAGAGPARVTRKWGCASHSAPVPRQLIELIARRERDARAGRRPRSAC